MTQDGGIRAVSVRLAAFGTSVFSFNLFDLSDPNLCVVGILGLSTIFVGPCLNCELRGQPQFVTGVKY